MAELGVTSGFQKILKSIEEIQQIVGVRSFCDIFAKLIKLKGKHDERI